MPAAGREQAQDADSTDVLLMLQQYRREVHPAPRRGWRAHDVTRCSFRSVNPVCQASIADRYQDVTAAGAVRYPSASGSHALASLRTSLSNELTFPTARGAHLVSGGWRAAAFLLALAGFGSTIWEKWTRN